jgi:anti-sigma factor RsiW
MMCETAEREGLAEQYVRGQLSPALKDEFEIHLLECPKCLGKVETLNEIQFGLRQREESIRDAEVVGQRRVRAWLVAVLVVLAIALITIGTWYFWK